MEHYTMEHHEYINDKGSYHEVRWNMVSNFPSQVGDTCAAHVVTDCIQYRYQLAYRRAGYNKLPFYRLSAQHLIDGASLKKNPRSKGTLFRMCYPMNWRHKKERGGGLMDITDYNAPEGMRGEHKWNKTILKCRELPQLPRYPLSRAKSYGHIFGKESKIRKIVNGLLDGPIYGDFYIYPNYGTAYDDVNHLGGEPHGSGEQSRMEKPEGHAILIIGIGTFTPWDGLPKKRYLVYRNSWEEELNGKDGFMRLFVESLSSVWIPSVPNIPKATSPDEDPRAPDGWIITAPNTWIIPAPDDDEISDSSSDSSS